MLVTIKTTQEDFDKAIVEVKEHHSSAGYCLIAQALNRHLKPPYRSSCGVTVYDIMSAHELGVGKKWLFEGRFPVEVWDSIRRFDAYNEYLPVEFEIDIPKEYLA